MKLQLCLKLVTAGAIAVGATTVLGTQAQAKPVVTTTTTTTPVQVTPVAIPPSYVGNCAPGGPAPCGQPPVMTPSVNCAPNGAAPCAPSAPTGCQAGVAPCHQQQMVVNPPITSDSFFCNYDRSGKPTTFASTPHGVLPLVKWVSHYFAQSGYDPEVRCREVSERFDRFYRQGQLNYITTGIVNNLPVVCVATELGGPCTGVLFTLKPNEDASRVIQQLFDVRAGASGPLYESGTREYVDIKRYMATLRPEGQ